MTYQINSQTQGKTFKFRIRHESNLLTFREVFDKWKTDAEFVEKYADVLRDAQFKAFFWEHPPLHAEDLDQPYECKLIDSHHLATVLPDPRPFRKHFNMQEPVVDFRNVGGDAQLIAPCPAPGERDYSHFAAFIDSAPDMQIEAFFQKMAELSEAALGESPIWLNTSGLGVHWLHARIDSRPKYYQDRDYRDVEFWIEDEEEEA